MPASTNQDGEATQWHAQPPLPSFYSPRTVAAGPADIDDDFFLSKDTSSNFTPTAESDAQKQRRQQQHQGPVSGPPPTHISRHAQPFHLADVSLPALVSPAFTPPGKPGTPIGTPSTSEAGAGVEFSEPRGVPVDSSVESGGCGNKRPRLLETLPKVECIVRARIPTVNGAQMFLHLYTNNVDTKEHLAIVFGEHIRSKSLDAPRPGESERERMTRGAYTGVLFPGRTESGMLSPSGAATTSTKIPSEQIAAPLVRVHSECYTGETVWSARCDCGEQLDEAARLMALPSNKTGGVIIYLRQEGRGIGLGEKLKAYNLQDLGSDTVEANLLLRHPADARSYGLATAMLKDLGQSTIRLLTNNPDKIRAVEGPNREVIVKERVPMVPLSWRGEGGFRSREVDGYLSTKIEKMGHLLDSNNLSQ